MNKKLSRIKLYGEKRGWLWQGNEGTKEFNYIFTFEAPQRRADLLNDNFQQWNGLQAALSHICNDGDFQDQCTISDIWGEAVYVDGRSTIAIPLEINPRTLRRWGFLEDDEQ